MRISMDRLVQKKWVFFISTLVVTFACKEIKTNATTESKQKRPPNIVIIMADDQGWGDLSYHGNNNLNTPHIDSLALNGVSFEHFFVQPVCSPTRAELLTGRHYPRTGVHWVSEGGERMNPEERTLAEILKESGYKTGAFGKWHNGMQPPYHPNSQGFDSYYGFTSGHWGNYFAPLLEQNGKLVKGEGFLTDDLTTKGLEFMTEHQNEPFFLYLPFNTPHSPMQVPDSYWARFEGKDLEQRYHGEETEDLNFTKAALAMVENIDDNVGRVSAKLKELDLEENTIVIYLSDNGPNGWRYNGGMRGKKGSTDDGGVRSPFFMQWKNVLPAGKKITQIASSVDVLPTLLKLVGTEAGAGLKIDGKDVTPLLTSSDATWEDRFVFNHWNGHTSVRTQQYRLDHQDRLYDMEKDPGQSTDISETFPQVTDSLKNAKAAWLKETNPLTKETDNRPFTLGYLQATYTQLPARDGIPHGNIKRSNQYPNNTFFTNWKSEKDSITWDVEVLADGEFEVQLYYTCKEDNDGVGLILSHGHSLLATRLRETHDPPLTGMENDRVPRMESYVKDFKAFKMGTIPLTKGRSQMTLKAMAFSGEEAIDIRLLQFKKVR